MKYEYCCKCDCATGKAGAGDDSLYTETDGPFCEDCFPEFKSKQEQGEPETLNYTVSVECKRCGSHEKYDLEVDYPPPQTKEWVKLTDEEISKVLYDSGDPDGLPEYARAIEAKSKEKNT